MAAQMRLVTMLPAGGRDTAAAQPPSPSSVPSPPSVPRRKKQLVAPPSSPGVSGKRIDPTVNPGQLTRTVTRGGSASCFDPVSMEVFFFPFSSSLLHLGSGTELPPLPQPELASETPTGMQQSVRPPLTCPRPVYDAENSRKVCQIGYDTRLSSLHLPPSSEPSSHFCCAAKNDTVIGHSSRNLADPAENLPD